MKFREKFREESGAYANVVVSDAVGNTYYSDEYTEWLEEKLNLLNKHLVIVPVCDDWIHDERVKCNDDNFCPICGKYLKAN